MQRVILCGIALRYSHKRAAYLCGISPATARTYLARAAARTSLETDALVRRILCDLFPSG